MNAATPLLACVAALSLAVVLLGGGARARRLLRLPLPPGLRLPADFLLGAGVLAAAVVLLALVGLMRPVPLVAVAVALGALGRWRGRWRWRALVPPLAAGAFVLPAALGPPFFYDALVYHLGLPWQALLEGRFTAHPENTFAAFPPLAQCLYAPPLALGLERTPAILHWAAFVIAGAAVTAFAQGLGARRPLAGMAGTCLVLLPSHVLVPGLPAAEGWLVAAVATAYALLLRPRLATGAPPLAGMLLGIACAARLQGLPWALGAAVLVAVRANGRARAVTLLALGWIAGAMPWWVKNLVLLGQPFAPVGWEHEGMATLWRDGGSTLLLGAPAGELGQRVGVVLAPLVPLAPWLAATALAAALALAQRCDAARRWAIACSLAGVAAWLLLGSLPRFAATPVLFLLALAAATRGAARWASATVLAAVAALGVAATVGLVSRLELWDTITGHTGAAREAIVDSPIAAFGAATVLPATARALFVGEPRGYAFPRRFVAPSQHDVSPLREPLERGGAAGARAWLREAGFTHLVLNHGELARLAPSYPVAPWRSETGRRSFAALLRDLAPPVVAVGEVEVYAVAAP